jgi:hypothetical protein
MMSQVLVRVSQGLIEGDRLLEMVLRSQVLVPDVAPFGSVAPTSRSRIGLQLKKTISDFVMIDC